MASSKDGLARTIKAIGGLKSKGPLTIAEGLRKGAEVILRKALTYVPVDTKALYNSGKVVEARPGATGKAAQFSVVFEEEYAVPVHENMEARHAPPTGAKYLDRAVRETRGTVASLVRYEVEVLRR